MIFKWGNIDFDWHQYGKDCVSNVAMPEPDIAEGWINNSSDSAIEHFFKQNDQVNITDVEILLANQSQMVVIAMVINRLLLIAQGHAIEQLFLLLGDMAGTGKTFVIKVINRIRQRLFHRNGAVLNLAPTGAASVLIPNGRIIHSVIPIPRKHKHKNMLTAQLCDFPMNNEQKKKLHRCTGTKEDRKVQALLIDERTQVEHENLAYIDTYLSKALLDNCPFGGTPVVILSGDNAQVPPVGAVDLHHESRAPKSPIRDKGYSLYKQCFRSCIVLNETMRQGPDQLSLHLHNTLLRIRIGEIAQQDWLDVNGHYGDDLSNEEKCSFNHERVITLCETWKDVNIENRHKLNDLGEPIPIVPAINTGKHTKGTYTAKFVGQIPPLADLTVGGRYILTKNQQGLTGYKLNNNGAMGIIKVICMKQTKVPQAIHVMFCWIFLDMMGHHFLKIIQLGFLYCHKLDFVIIVVVKDLVDNRLKELYLIIKTNCYPQIMCHVEHSAFKILCT